ncbi:class I SAM-dependent methyltransferase [bacterium BMS3Abin03]|nr:class I SAM-dependent methyltransferase [bacterium BMS3Abin03]
MDTRKAYDDWSKQYDSNINKTRDLEAKALREILSEVDFNSCLEIGCGTGKNTEWLVTKAKRITAVDLSKEMLSKAREKINSDKVQFLQTDITKSWFFTKVKFDLVTFSLVLEHIENLDHIFNEAAKVLIPGGYIYIGELHPFKQYTGTKARYDSNEGLQILDCYNHNISDFIQSAKRSGFEIENINEYFDDEDRTVIPRILTLFLIKK